MTDQQKRKLIQLVLYATCADYNGSSNGEVVRGDSEEVEKVIKDIRDGCFPKGSSADLLNLALLACGYSSSLVDNGVAGKETGVALQKVFGVPQLAAAYRWISAVFRLSLWAKTGTA